MPKEEKSEPWKGICCKTCWYAKGKRCKCRCGGKYHGMGNPNYKHERARRLDESIGEKILPESQAKKFREQITDPRCLCGFDLSDEPIRYYGPHSGGWKVEGESEPQWLYIVCPKCGWQAALWKLGVPRERF